MMLPAGATPIRPITERRSLAPSSSTRRPLGYSCESLSQQVALPGRRRAYHVPPLSPCGLGRASPPVVRRLRRRSSEPPDLTTYLLVQAIQHLALGLCDDVYQRFTYVDRTTQSWFPTPWMLGVAALASRPRLPSVQEEATLFRELRTPRFPVTRVPVGYCGQHRRSCHSEESMTVTATASCRTRTTKLSRRGPR
jgi:hypothetical protein